MLLKWGNKTIGKLEKDGTILFCEPNYNEIVSIYTKGKEFWDKKSVTEFIRDRVIDRNRRDIEKVLFRLGLSKYDEVMIARKTRAINPKDMFWFALQEDEVFEEVVNDKFDEIFMKNVNQFGKSNYSPDGVNKKSYGVSKGNYGLFKERLHPYSTDVESEEAVYLLSELMGVTCCPVWRVKKDNGEFVLFSKFDYQFNSEYVVHARQFFKDGEREEDEYSNLKKKFPEFLKEIQQMILIDFVTRQTDRHLSNFSIKFGHDGRVFYGLYDNGRSLFHEDKGEFIKDAVENIELYSSKFGNKGTYYDAVVDISQEADIAELVNLDLIKEEIHAVYEQAGLEDERLAGATEWSFRALQILKKIS